MKGSRIPTTILSVRVIPNAEPAFLEAMRVPAGHRSIGLMTTDCDDVSYAALDEATKKADVRVAYAKSMYAGAKSASTRLAGEFIGILSGSGPSEVKSGLEAAMAYIEQDAAFYSADDNDSVVYFAHLISRTGSYLSELAGVEAQTSMAYLIAPPLEGMVGLEAAMKAAAVKLSLFYGPPTETNFAGGLLTGGQSDCKAACDAFARTVCEIAKNPLERM